MLGLNFISKREILTCLGAVAIAGSCLGTAAAAPPKKVSYEGAWKLCKAELDRDKTPGVLTSNDRYLRGGACMKRYGYNL